MNNYQSHLEFEKQKLAELKEAIAQTRQKAKSEAIAMIEEACFSDFSELGERGIAHRRLLIKTAVNLVAEVFSNTTFNELKQ